MKRIKGYFQIISCFFFALLGLQIKIISSQINTETIVFFRSFIGCLIIFSLILISKKKFNFGVLHSKNISIHLLRSIFGVLAMYFGYKSLSYISLAQASTIGFTKVFFTSILTIVFFKEKIKISNFSLLFFGFLGVFLISNPGEINSKIGFYMGIFSAFCVSGGILSISFLSKKDKTLLILLYHSFISTIIFFLIFNDKIIFKINYNLLFLILLTLTALIGQYFNTESYKNFETGKVVLMSYSRIIFSTILGFFFLNENISFFTLLGVSIVILTTFLVENKHPD